MKQLLKCIFIGLMLTSVCFGDKEQVKIHFINRTVCTLTLEDIIGYAGACSSNASASTLQPGQDITLTLEVSNWYYNCPHIWGNIAFSIKKFEVNYGDYFATSTQEAKATVPKETGNQWAAPFMSTDKDQNNYKQTLLIWWDVNPQEEFGLTVIFNQDSTSTFNFKADAKDNPLITQLAGKLVKRPRAST